ncbi:hypothetical protein ABTQ33_01330 [Paucilactobacillus suebicus]|nr:hypothetical protein [Paucilactobacillus suebicus]
MDLAKYVDYFKSMRNREIPWTSMDGEDGILQMGYPKYDEQMLQFIREFKESSDFDPRYKKTLRHYHIRVKMNHLTIGQVMLVKEMPLYKAMLSLIVTAEQVDAGSWAKALQEGYLYQVTKAIVSEEQTRV